MRLNLIRTVKGLKFLAHWQAKKLVCHSLVNEGKKHDTLGSETKESLLLIALAVAIISSFSCVCSLSPGSHKVMQRGPGNT